ncbi:hypothetical protein D3C77_508430 [compost metagenome]
MLLATAVPILYCAAEDREILTPNFLKTYWVKPEQSKPTVEIPPNLYGVPFTELTTDSNLDGAVLLAAANVLPVPIVRTMAKLVTTAATVFLKMLSSFQCLRG